MQIKNENQSEQIRIATVERNDGPQSDKTGTAARAIGEDMKRL
jgi:hypothetical protein